MPDLTTTTSLDIELQIKYQATNNTTASKQIDIDNLISKLTPQEKVSLLSAKDWWRTPVISRPGDGVFIPHIKTTDGPNGARGESYVSGITAACFPCSTSAGASWDVKALHRLGAEIGKEAKEMKAANVLLAPTINIIRSPLGGRNYETYGEDPFLLGTLGAAFVNGCQEQGVAATPKHFVANDSEKDRTKMSSNVEEQVLREIYLMPFQLVMRGSDPWCFMTSYNKVNGEHTSDSKRLIDDILRKEWGFKGAVISDWMGTYSTSQSVLAGLDLEMPGPTKWRGQKLLDAVNKGEVPTTTIDTRVKHVLELAVKTGRFEDPEEAPEQSIEIPERRQFIIDSAAEGAVLLKNDNDVLPIREGQSIAIIGHHATEPTIGGGGSAKVLAQHIISPLQGLDAAGVKYTYSPGVPVYGALPHAPPDIISPPSSTPPPSSSNETPILLEWFNGPVIGQNQAHTQFIPTPEYMIKEAWPSYLSKDYCTRISFSLTPKTTGTHTFSAITTGTAKIYINSTLVFTREQEKFLLPESFYFYKSKIERRFTFPMVAGETYEAEMHSWATDPDVLERVDGKMFQGNALRFKEFLDIPRAIADAADAAAGVDVAIICVGTTNEIESEGYDRSTMDLPGEQYELIKACAAARNGKGGVVVVNFSGAPVTLGPAVLGNVCGLLQMWFPGQEAGHSLVKVLMGHTNPSGRLPMSWPRRDEDNPAYGNFPCGEDLQLDYKEGLSVGYRWYDRKDTPEVEFGFGFGLSYTRFGLEGLGVGEGWFNPVVEGEVLVEVVAKNLGDREGKVVVQIYVSIPDGDGDGDGSSSSSSASLHVRPPKELKAFEKVSLAAGESKNVRFRLDDYSFSVFDAEVGKWKVQKGKYVVHAALSAQEVVESREIEATQELYWNGV